MEHQLEERAVASEAAGHVECLPRLVADVARTRPDAVALAGPGLQVSYAQLDADAGRLADLLADRGVGRESVVGVSLPRGRELVTAVLAVHKRAAGYLPLDPGLPVRRRESLLAAAGARVVISHAGADDTPGGRETVNPADADPGGPLTPGREPAPVDPADLACLIFTSGSTGLPKPVAVTHGGLVRHAEAIRAAYELGPRDRVLQFANPAFDVFGEELHPTLLAGATLVIPPDPLLTPSDLAGHLHRERVTVANLPTPYWDQWVQDLDARRCAVPATLRLLVVGSDVGHTSTLDVWWRHCAVPVINAYGLTEATITATVHRFEPGELPDTTTLPIGRPLPGVQAHLLDAALRPVPDGSTGDLYLGGALLARGYAAQPAPTAERFVPDPVGGRPGARLYRTGDLALRLPDGALRFLGRSDEQVKIRGQRVEPAEISAALRGHPAVRDAHVRAVPDPFDGRRLVAYVVADRVDAAHLRAHLADVLPPAMVPSDFVLLPELPLTANGKIDHRALPLPAGAAADARPASPTPGASGLEELVAAIWREVLRTDHVGLDDGFFEIGGHSMLMVRVQRRLSAELGRQVDGVSLFAHPTIRKLAAHLATDGGPDAPDAPDALAAADDGRADERRDGLARMRQRRARRSSGDGR